MKKFLSIIIAVSFLAGCAQRDLDVKSEEASFEKKKECSEFRSKIEAQIKKDWPPSEVSAHATLEKIFYSPKKNSCLYSFRVDDFVNGVSYEHLSLIDALTNEKLAEETGCIPEEKCAQSWVEARLIFSKQLKEYQ